jgi:hypothetical protein
VPVGGVDESTPGRNFPAAELERLLGLTAVSWERVESGGYGRVSAHWRVRLGDGRSVFVKQALSEDAQAWLRQERIVYEGVDGAFMPAYFGTHDDGGEVFLVIEDLSRADWPPPWSPERIDAVLAALAELRSTPPPEGIARLDDERGSIVGWSAVRDDPEPLLSTGVCTREWLERALPVFLRAGEEATARHRRAGVRRRRLLRRPLRVAAAGRRADGARVPATPARGGAALGCPRGRPRSALTASRPSVRKAL